MTPLATGRPPVTVTGSPSPPSSLSLTPTPDEVRSARWVAGLFVLVVLLQRLGIPGVPNLGALTGVVVAWVAAAGLRGVVTFDRTRLMWWLGAMGVGGAFMLLQQLFVARADISVQAWLLVLVIWLPFTTRLVHRGPAAYLRLLRYACTVSTVLALLTIAMVGSQLLGVAYVDWFSRVVPAALQLDGFNTVTPIIYGSPIVKGNAWIGIEPSVTSALIGLGLLSGLLCGVRVWRVVVLIVGMVATVSGSGIVICIVGVAVMLFTRSRRMLSRYWFLAVLTVVAMTFTQLGSLLLSRSTELRSDNSSASLRAIQPYEYLWPRWISDPVGVVLGYGPGSAQKAVTESNILGLLVPSPIKVFFEYGLVAGIVLAGFLLLCYWGGPSRAMSLALLLSLWLLQPGVTTAVFVAPVLIFVTLWSPRPGPALETLVPVHDHPSPGSNLAVMRPPPQEVGAGAPPGATPS